MTFSDNAKARMVRRLVVASLAVLASVLAACTSPGTAPGGGSSTPTTPAASSHPPTASPSPSETVQVGKDGRTVEAGKTSESCTVLSDTAIKEVLGPWGESLQPGQGEVSTDPEGVGLNSCVYPLVPGGGTDRSLIIDQYEFLSRQQLDERGPTKLLMTSEPVTGLKGEAVFGVNSLSGSKEFILISSSDAHAARLLLSLPSGVPAPGDDEAKSRLVQLGKAAGF